MKITTKTIEKKDFRRTVLALLRNNNGELLITFNPRVNSKDSKNIDKNTYKFPQGGIEVGETAKEALVREMKEELGIDVSKYKIFKLNDYISYWFINSDKPDFEIRLCPFLIDVGDMDLNNLTIDESEISDLIWISPKKIENLDLGIRHCAYLSILRRFNLI